MKRAFDVFVVLSLGVLLLPLIGVLASAVRCRLGSPVFFLQERIGLSNRPFTLIKFRTLTDQTDKSGELLSDAERLTTFGSKLRATSLDELPELWNVLRGEMSLVGPRPLLPEYLPLYSDRELKRHNVPPGITGWAQINGRNTLNWDQKFNLDVWYVENQSILLDIKILVSTLKQVVSRKGISFEGEATMRAFQGHGKDEDV